MASATLTYPACCTTKDGVTHTVKDAATAKKLGFDTKQWEARRGAFFEAGLPVKTDGRKSVGAAKAQSEVEKTPVAPTPVKEMAKDVPATPSKPSSTKHTR